MFSDFRMARVGCLAVANRESGKMLTGEAVSIPTTCARGKSARGEEGELVVERTS